jgi:hypothetical protein
MQGLLWHMCRSLTATALDRTPSNSNKLAWYTAALGWLAGRSGGTLCVNWCLLQQDADGVPLC